MIPDGTGDVWKQSGEDGFTLVGTAPNTDLTETRVTHRGRHVVIRAAYDALEKGAPEEFEYRGILRVPRPNGLRRFVISSGRPAERTTKYSLAHYWEGALVDCAGLTGRTRFGADVLNVRIPRRCLGNPRWVQFQGAAYSYTEEGLLNDDAQRPGRTRHRFGPGPGREHVRPAYHDGPQHPQAVYTISGLDTSCEVASQIDYQDNVVRLVLPADCIGPSTGGW